MIKITLKLDEECLQIKRKLQKTEKSDGNEIYFSLNNVVNFLFKDIIYFPNDPGLNTFLLDELHKIPTAGHPRYERLINVLRRDYYW